MLTGNQIVLISEDSNQAGISNHTWKFLQEEVITTVGDIVKFTEDNIWRQVIDNLKCTPHLAPSGSGALIPQKPFCIAAKSQIRLKVAAVAISYYEWTSHPLTSGTI